MTVGELEKKTKENAKKIDAEFGSDAYGGTAWIEENSKPKRATVGAYSSNGWKEVELKKDDGSSLGFISQEGLKAISENKTDKYIPINNEEKKTINSYIEYATKKRQEKIDQYKATAQAKLDDIEEEKSKISDKASKLRRSSAVASRTGTQGTEWEIKDTRTAKEKREGKPISQSSGQKRLDALNKKYDKLDKEAEALIETISDIEKYANVVYNETGFWDQAKANYGQGRLSQDMAAAYNDYIDSKTEANKLRAEALSAVSEQFAVNNKNALALDDENDVGSVEKAAREWVAVSFAGYLPQLIDQTTASIKGAAVGGATGAAAGSIVPGIGTAIGLRYGIKSGWVAGASKQMFETTRGMVFKSLLDAGYGEETALEAANDEAFVSSIIEGAGEIVSMATLGTGKLVSKIAPSATKKISGNIVVKGVKGFSEKTGKTISKNLFLKTTKAVAGVFVNAVGEYAEEYTQEAVSIANENRLKDNNSKSLLGETFSVLRNPTAEMSERLHNAGTQGFRVGLMMGGATKIGTSESEHISNVNTGRQIKNADIVQSVIDVGLNQPEKSLSNKLATKLNQKDKISSSTLGKLANANKGETVSIGETYYDTKSKAIYRVVSRDDSNTTIELTTPDGGKISKSFSNESADNLTNLNRYVLVSNTLDTTETAQTTDTANSSATSISVGDVFYDTKTGNTLKIVSRNAENTVIVEDNGKSKAARTFKNSVADRIVANAQYEKVGGNSPVINLKSTEIENAGASSGVEISDGTFSAIKVPFNTKEGLVKYVESHIGSEVRVTTNDGASEIRTIKSLSRTGINTVGTDGVVRSIPYENVGFTDTGFTFTNSDGSVSTVEFVNPENTKTQGDVIETESSSVNEGQLLKNYVQIVENVENISNEDALALDKRGTLVNVLDNTPEIILNNVDVAENYPVVFVYRKLYCAIRDSGVFKEHYHDLGTKIALKLPEYLSDPDLILRTKDNRINILTEIESKKGNAGIIAIELNATKNLDNKYKKYNVIVTMFGSDDKYVGNLLSNKSNRVEYIKKDLLQVNSQRHTWLSIINNKSFNDNTISQNSDIVNNSVRNSAEVDTKNKVPFNTKEGLVKYVASHIGDKVRVALSNGVTDVRTLKSVDSTGLRMVGSDGKTYHIPLNNVAFNETGFAIGNNGGVVATFDFVNVDDTASTAENQESNLRFSLDGAPESMYEKMDKLGLTHDEQRAILEYKSSESYDINDKLRSSQTLTEQEQKIVSDLNAALDKIPVYKGKVYRNIGFNHKLFFDSFMTANKQDSVITSDAFMSTSKTIDGYVENSKYKVHYEIESMSGKDVENIGLRSEREVLFKTGTQFSVLATKLVNNDYYLILREENVDAITNTDDRGKNDRNNLSVNQGQTLRESVEKLPSGVAVIQGRSSTVGEIFESEPERTGTGSKGDAYRHNKQNERNLESDSLSTRQVLSTDSNGLLRNNGETGKESVNGKSELERTLEDGRERRTFGENGSKIDYRRADEEVYSTSDTVRGRSSAYDGIYSKASDSNSGRADTGSESQNVGSNAETGNDGERKRTLPRVNDADISALGYEEIVNSNDTQKSEKYSFESEENTNAKEENRSFLDRLQENVKNLENTQQIFNVSNDSIKKTGKITDSIELYFDSIGGKAVNPTLGVVELNKKGAKTTVFHGMSGDKFTAVAAIKDVIEKGKIIAHSKNWKNRGYDTYLLAGKGNLNGNEAIVGVIIKNYPNSKENNKFYLHEIIKIGVPHTAVENNTIRVNEQTPIDNSILSQDKKIVNNNDTQKSEKYSFESEENTSGRNAEIRMSISDVQGNENNFNLFEAVATSVTEFSDQINRWLGGKMKSGELFDLGKTPKVLEVLGAKNLPIVMSQDVIVKITGGKHNISLGEIKKIPSAIADPIMVFKSATVKDSFVILTEITDKSGNDVVVALHLNKYQNRINVNKIASVYGKDNIKRFVEQNVKSGNLKYMDKNKSQEWSTSRGLQLPKLVQSNPDNNNILQKEDIVNNNITQNTENYSFESGENTNDGIDLKFSIENIPGTDKKYVQANEQVIKSENSDDWETEIFDYVNKVVRNGEDFVIPMDNEENITITERTAWKLSDRGNFADDYYMVKGNASGVIDEIISVSKYLRSKPPMKPHSDGFARYGFDYRKAYFMDLDGKYYELQLSVGINADGREAYNIGQIKQVAVPSKRLKGPKGTTTSNDNITQKNNIVNTHSMQNTDKYSFESEGNVNGGNDIVKSSISESFYDEYENWVKNGRKNGVRFRLGTTSKALQSIGVKKQNIIWDTSKINKSLNEHKYLTDEILKQVPEILENPVIVMQSKHSDSRLTMFGEVYDGDRLPIMAVIELLPTNLKNNFILDEIKVVSTHSRKNVGKPADMTQTQSIINTSDILYVDPNKKRTDNWLVANRLQLPLHITNYGSIKSVTYPVGDVNTYSIQKENNYAVESEDVTNVRDDLLLKDGNRRSDESAGEQAGQVSEFEQENQGKTEKERTRTAKELFAKGKTKKTVVGNVVQLNLVDADAHNEDMQFIVQRYAERGMNVHFFVGQGIRRNDTSREFKIDGFEYNGEAYLRYDGKTTPQKLAKHELVHLEWDSEAVQQAKEIILGKLSEEQKKEILELERYQDYMELYSENEDLVWQEFVADTLAGMNEYSERFSDIVQAYWSNHSEFIDSYKVSEYTESIDAGGVNNGYAGENDSTGEISGRNAEKERTVGRRNKGRHSDESEVFTERHGTDKSSNSEKNDNQKRTVTKWEIIKDVYHGSQYRFKKYEKSYTDIGIHFGTKEQAVRRMNKEDGIIDKHDLILKNPLHCDDVFGERTPQEYVLELINNSSLNEQEKVNLKDEYDTYVKSKQIVEDTKRSLERKLASEKYRIETTVSGDGIFVSIILLDDDGKVNQIPKAELLERAFLQEVLGEAKTEMLLKNKQVSSLAKAKLSPFITELAKNIEMDFLQLRKIEDILKTFGYDGFAYQNENEGAGWSYAVFDDSQIIRAEDAKGVNESDIRFSFAGEKAETADKSLLEKAKVMLNNGVLKETVFKKTGWFKGVDGKWRFEIDDSKSKFFFEKLKQETTLENVLKNDDLYQSYPFLKNIKVKTENFGSRNRKYGQFDYSTNTLSLSDEIFDADVMKHFRDQYEQTIIHEVQHAIQFYEGFELGGSPDEMLGYLRMKAQEFLVNSTDAKLQQILASGSIAELDKYVDDFIVNQFGTKNIKEASKQAYLLLHGEKEAYAAEERMLLTTDERKKLYPNYGKGAVLRNEIEGRNINDRISETPERIPESEFISHLYSDSGRGMGKKAGMGEELRGSGVSQKEVRFSFTEDTETDIDNAWNEKIEEYGTIPKGENPSRDVDVPKKVAKTVQSKKYDSREMKQLREYIMQKNFGSDEILSVDCKEIGNNFYIWENLSKDTYDVTQVIKIEGNEDLISDIRRRIKNGTDESTGFIVRMVTEYKNGRRRDYSNNALRKNPGSDRRNVGLSIGKPESVERRYSEKSRGNSSEVRDGRGIKFSLSEDTKTDIDPKWAEKNEEYGTILKGENPTRDIDIPKKISDKKVVSRFARTMLEAGVTPDDTVSEFEKRILDGEMTHEVITNKKALENARKTIEYDGFQDALNDWYALARKGKVDKESLVLGMELYNQCITNKDTHNAMKIAADLAAEATRAGQTLQACRMLKLMSPDGRLYYLEQSVRKMNDEFRKKVGEKYKDIELDEDLLTEFFSETDEDVREYQWDRICQNIANQVPATLMDKWDSWRYLAMLGNVRTHMRNVVGNATFVPAIRISNMVEAMLERGFIKKENRTKAFKKDKAAIEFAKKDFSEIEKIIQGSNGKYAVTEDIESRRTIFKNKVLEKLRTTNFNFLEMEDLWFLKLHYVDALAQVITARGIDVKNIDAKTLDTIRAFAIKEAQAATYRDANALAEALGKIERKAKRSDNKVIRAGGVIVEGIMPFKKTPMNIAKQGINYSPVGILTATYKGLARLKNGDAYSANDVIKSLSRGLTGTGMMLLGYFLTSIGVLVGGDDEDKKKKNFDKLTGEQSYALKIGDQSYTIDWMLPSCLPFFVGNELFGLTKDAFKFADIVNATSTLAEPLLELSVFSGINDVIQSASYSNTSPIEAVTTNIVSSYVLQALPTLGGQLSRIIDPQKREYYYADKTSGVPIGIQRFIGQASSKIPFASYLFTPSIDEWGREETYGGFAERVLENTVSPGYYSKENYTEVDKELKRLYEATGENAVLPVTQQKYYKEDKIVYYMSAADYAEVMRLRGQKSFELINELIKSSKYAKMTDEEKVKAISNCYKDAGDYAKDQMLDKVKAASGK